MATPVILIFDVGKTNKKALLFDEQYNLVYEEATHLQETADEDGYPCEDVTALTHWLTIKFTEITSNPAFEVKAVNFSGYGASFVNIGADGKPVTPLYNYLKPYPEHVKEQFYNTYGGESSMAKHTASPVLGNLNSGMQLYRLKYEKPAVFASIKYSLHLPQYLAFVLTGQVYTDITSIGCHTGLWDYQNASYHAWVLQEGIDKLFAPIFPGDKTVAMGDKNLVVGMGLHDSSAALVPYLASVGQPFILLSTGTWCISLNPFNHSVLSDYELNQDCLCYLTYQGKPVKASRLFAGYEHEQQVKRLAEYFKVPEDYYKTVAFDASQLGSLQNTHTAQRLDVETAMVQQSGFGGRPLQRFTDYEAAYHQLMHDIMVQQVHSLKLVLSGTSVKQIFVDGGFGTNPIYMHLLANAFPQLEVYAAAVGQASALGAALAFHDSWNSKPVPENIIGLRHYAPQAGGSI